MNINRILVAGGSGFIGSHCIRHLLAKYPTMQVVNVDNLSTGSIANLSDVKTDRRYHFVRADIRANDTLDAILSEGVDAVINASGVRLSPLGQQRPYIEGNLSTLAVLLDRIAHYNGLEGYQVQRFIQLSSYEVYGNAKVHDAHRFQPVNRYAVSKAAGDMECGVRIHDTRIPAMILRMCELYGPAQHTSYGLAALYAHRQDWLDMRFPYETYEWLSVYDLVNAIDFLIHRGKVGEIYHAGSGEYASVRDIQKAIQNKTSLKSTQQHGDYPLVNAHDLNTLGWVPRVSFEEEMASMK